MKNKKRSRTIFGTILVPLLLLLIVEALLFSSVFTFGGTINQLKRNSEQLLGEQLENHKDYLEYFMVNQWSDLDSLSDTINRNTQLLLDSNSITLEQLESDPAVCHRVLQTCYADFINELYTKRVNGIFVMFNTQDLTTMFDETSAPQRTGLMIRDLDTDSASSSRNTDLLLMRAPIATVQSLNIATDAEWKPMFVFSEEESQENYDFLYQPFQAAYEADHVEDPSDYGYWSPGNAKMYDSAISSVTYSVPLILNDGTVYGVLGVEMINDYFYRHVPDVALGSSQASMYILARVNQEEDGLTFQNGLTSSDTMQEEEILSSKLIASPYQTDGYTAEFDKEEYYVAGKQFNIYSNNTPFQNQKWMLFYAAESASLYAGARRTEVSLFLALILVGVVGLFGSFLITRRLSHPISRLSKEVAEAQTADNSIPSMSKTGIKEIDQFSTAFTQLSQSAIYASTRVLNLLKMTSMEIAGFEVRVGEKLFVTDNFFSMFGLKDESSEKLTDERFKKVLRKINAEFSRTKSIDGSTIYEVKLPTGEIRYVRLCFATLSDGMAAVAEDITPAELEKKRVEHERDYDLLTGLFNRRAFYREVETKLHDPDLCNYGAIIMMDLDDLKRYNDTYGHEWGDQYITQAARSICAAAPANSIVSHLSGDEYALFMYGFSSQEEARTAVQKFSETTTQTNRFIGPNGEEHTISFTGGVAWFPSDSQDMLELMKYADFAMYEMKKSNKGQLNEFDFGSYNQESFLVQSRRELDEILKTGNLQYHFQPIVRASDGSIYGYEALMRVNMPTLRTPDTVLNLARNEGRLQDVERLTMLKSVEHYNALLAAQAVSPQSYLFINSIADHYLNSKDQEELKALAGPLVSQIVLEITESNEVDPECLRIKREMTCYSGMLALDDYGSGYNGNKNLLELAPKYIKVDASLTRGIDSNADKQALVANLIDYAHHRNMIVVVEGIETTAELQKCIELDVDLLQGYVLARPAAVPNEISAEALQAIRKAHKTKE